MSSTIGSLRHPREKFYQILMIIFGIVLWGIIARVIFAAIQSPTGLGRLAPILFYAAIFMLYYLLGPLFYRAYAYGNMILVGPKQFPELHDMVVSAAHDIGLSAAPVTFLYNSNGLFNAFARRVLGGRYVFLTSALVDATNDAQVRFVVGHEIGHHAAGHLNPWLNFLKLPARVVPFLSGAYSRSREYTCDNIGAHLSRDTASSCSALQMLGCGCKRLNQSMSCEAFMEQESKVPAVFGFLNEVFRSHPRLTRRVGSIAARGAREGRREGKIHLS
jgi:Zn-dependent protease with chaperone function